MSFLPLADEDLRAILRQQQPPLSQLSDLSQTQIDDDACEGP